MLLLDTHAFLWFLNDDSRLPEEICKMIQTSEAVYISIVSFWEMAIKNSLGKLELPQSISRMMEDCVDQSFMILPIYNSLNKIDENVINAARDLGANTLQTFLKITLPLSLPA